MKPTTYLSNDIKNIVYHQ